MSEESHVVKTIMLNVTDEDIKQGKPGDPCACAVALALTREFQQPCTVGSSYAYVHSFDDPNNDPKYYITLPYQVRAFISDVDADIKVQPFSHQLEVHNKCHH